MVIKWEKSLWRSKIERQTYVEMSSSFRSSRPFSVTLLAVLVLILTTLYWLRLVETLRLWAFLSRAPISLTLLHRIYLAVTGALWGLVGLPLTWGLWRGRTWAPRSLSLIAILYSAYYWLDRLFLAVPKIWRPRWPFAVAATVILLVLTFWTLSRPGARAFFSKD
ncbi:MAG: hypothetical protein PVG14_19570 [Anaerolineales bacterium]